jgi:hypothetical protein
LHLEMDFSMNILAPFFAIYSAGRIWSYSALAGVMLFGVSSAMAQPRVLYAHELRSAAYPDFTRRSFKVPDWATFGGQPQVVGSRYIAMNEEYFNQMWRLFELEYVPARTAPATLEVTNVDCDGTVLVDDFSVREVTDNSANLLANGGFESRDPKKGWKLTAGTNLYRDGYNGGQSMLVRAGHEIAAQVPAVAGRPLRLTMRMAVLGRKRGSVRVSLGQAGATDASLTVAEETGNQSSGLVYWPNLNLLVNPISDETLATWRKHNIIVHNLGGYGPGGSWTGSYGQGLANPATLAKLKAQMNERYTGSDIGEQDARWANVFEYTHEPFSRLSNFPQFEAAHRYQGQVALDTGQISSLLTNLWLWHYTIKDGVVTMAGAQTQPREGIANAQLQYAFLRGAGKQYGVPLWGNVSVFSTDWDRDGPLPDWKNWDPNNSSGNSMSLMRRTLFAQYLYGCRILSFEMGMRFEKDVSPSGTTQEALVQTINQYGRLGTMQTPVALLQDYWSGWMPARYNRGNYYTWNARDYDEGDFLSHNLFSLLYPKYEDNGFYQNQQGGLTDTPYGDVADVLLSDVTAGVMPQYGIVIAAGNLSSPDEELRDKVNTFVAGGGDFVVTGANARRLWPQWRIGQTSTPLPAGSEIIWANGSKSIEPNMGSLLPINGSLPAGAQVLARFGAMPAILEIPRGKGRITLLLSPFGQNSTSLASLHPKAGRNEPLPKPYVLLAHVERLFAERLDAQRLFGVGNRSLGYITTQKTASEFYVGIYNNSLQQQPFRIESFIGPIRRIEELDLGAGVQHEVGYWPLGSEKNDGGISDGYHIAGGDIRIFKVQTAPTPNSVRVLPEIQLPKRPRHRVIAMPGLMDLKQRIQKWPTFFEHFDGVKLDWTAVRDTDIDLTIGEKTIRYEPFTWLQRQQVHYVVDFSSGFSAGELTLRSKARGYPAAVREVGRTIDKLSALGGRADILLPLEQVAGSERAAYVKSLHVLCQRAARIGARIHLRYTKTPLTPQVSSLVNLINEVGASNLHVAAVSGSREFELLTKAAGSRLGLVLVPNAAAPFTAGARLAGRGVVVALDGRFTDWNTAYRVARLTFSTHGPEKLSARVTNAATSAPTAATNSSVLLSTHHSNAKRSITVRGLVNVSTLLEADANFWKHFGGIKLDYKNLAYMDPAACRRLGAWLRSRGVRVIVDFSADMNEYPDLRLTDSTTPGDGVSAAHRRTVAITNDVFDKMKLMGLTQCLIRPCTDQAASYAAFCDRAWERGGIMVFMQHYMDNWMTDYQKPANVAKLIDDAKPRHDNLRMAINGCHEKDLAGLVKTAGDRLGLVLLGTPGSDRADVHGRMRDGMTREPLAKLNQTMILDSEYNGWDDVAADLAYMDGVKD